MADKIYLIRHGESVANSENLSAGWLDSPLTDNGREQAAAARGKLEKYGARPDIVVHTGLSRTRETAEILNMHAGAPMREVRDLIEQNFGDWQGGPWARVHEGLENNEEPPGGENAEEFMARVVRGMAVVEQLPGQIWVATHGGVMKALMRHYRADVMRVTNCMVCEVLPITKQIKLLD